MEEHWILEILITRQLLTACHFSSLALAPDPHEKWLQLDLVQLLECSLDVALVGREDGNDVLTREVSLSAKLVVLKIPGHGFKIRLL